MEVIVQCFFLVLLAKNKIYKDEFALHVTGMPKACNSYVLL